MAGPFHDGESKIQQLTGEAALGRRSGRFIQPILSARAQGFLVSAATLNIGVSDASGRVWSFLAQGDGPLVSRIDDQTARIERQGMVVPDALWGMLSEGDAIGLVAMDLSSARRFRINGQVASIDADAVGVTISETCPNCPKYIQQRLPVADHSYGEVATASGADLSAAGVDMIGAADTFFVASKGPDGKHDASHRGGFAGFVTVSGNRLTIPDYIGNSMFMTLGNLAVDPRAGVTFVDFDKGAQLNLTGTTNLHLEDARAHDGAEGRFWTFEVEAWSLTGHQPQPAWALAGYSRFNPAPPA